MRDIITRMVWETLRCVQNARIQSYLHLRQRNNTLCLHSTRTHIHSYIETHVIEKLEIGCAISVSSNKKGYDAVHIVLLTFTGTGIVHAMYTMNTLVCNSYIKRKLYVRTVTSAVLLHEIVPPVEVKTEKMQKKKTGNAAALNVSI